MMECFYVGGMLFLSTGNGLDDAVINVNRVDYFQQMPDNQAKIQFSSSGIWLENWVKFDAPIAVVLQRCEAQATRRLMEGAEQ